MSLVLIATICYSIHPEFISRFPSILRFLFPNQSTRIGRQSLDKLSSKAVFVSFDTFRYFRSHRPLSSPTRKCYRPCCAHVSGSTLFFFSGSSVRANIRSVLVSGQSVSIITSSLLVFGAASPSAACDYLSRDREPNSLVPGY